MLPFRLMIKITIIWFPLLWLSPLTSSPSSTLKTLKHGGSISGLRKMVETESGTNVPLNVYLGIPFALPPTDDLRFALPVEHPGWTNQYNATKLPPSCWQFSPMLFDQNNAAGRIWLSNTEMSEDCLYLNVWEPIGAGKKLPVLVWIYGGSYTTGTSTLTVYDGSILAAKHNVVVVSMQYRLGAFGFLRLDPNSFQSNENVSNVAMGNQAIHDQITALKWVNENIDRFGGDPDKVTLVGESTGAVSISILWLSPLAQPFFKRIIIQSASVLARWALHNEEEAHDASRKFVEALECPTTDRTSILECLQNASASDLVDKLANVTLADTQKRIEHLQRYMGQRPMNIRSSQKYFDVAFRPVVDGKLLPDRPEIMLLNKSLKQSSEMIVGINKNEGMYFVLYGIDLGESFLTDNGNVRIPKAIELAGKRKPMEGLDFKWLIASQVLDVNQMHNVTAKMASYHYGLPTGTDMSTGYADPDEVQMNGVDIMNKLDALTGDLDFVCPALNFAQHVAGLDSSRVYMYSFEHRTDHIPMPSWAGMMHGFEIEYVFGMPRSDEFQRNYYKFTSEERKLSDKVMRLWTNFAKYGDPNQNDDGSKESPIWPEYKAPKEGTPIKDDYLIIDTTFKTGKRLKQRNCRFWLHQMKDMTEFISKLRGSSSKHKLNIWGLLLMINLVIRQIG